MKKTIAALLFFAVSLWVFAQEEESSSFFMGLWIETTSNNTFLIRDIATGEKAGFEFNRAAIYTKANWWFWAEFASKFQLDAEIGVWEADIPLYQANSFGGNIPDTTWGDGFQGISSVLFAPVFGLNGQSVGGFNKLGFNINSPYVQARLGYGLLKEGGMSEFTGIYNVIDRWDDVGRGYTELHLGESLRQFGNNVTLNTFAAFSRMRAEYGVYSLVHASFFDKAEATVSFGSTTNSGELFRYNEQNENAFSLYGSYAPLETLSFSFHGLTSFGTGFDSGLNASAIALGAEFEVNNYSAELTLSLAGPDVITVWGDDETVDPDSFGAYLVQWFTVNDNVKIGLDTGAAFYNTEQFSEGLINIRNQPMFDLNFNNLGMSLSLYGVLQLDRIALFDDSKQPWVFWFEEAGLELTLNEIPAMQKIVFNYAMFMEYADWNNGYDLETLYNSIMFSANINDNLLATAGSIIRVDSPSPLGFAVGASIKTNWKIGAPRLWSHIAYGMDPYEDNNYTLFRADDPLNNPMYRTYLLNRLNDHIDKCRISIGLIWEL